MEPDRWECCILQACTDLLPHWQQSFSTVTVIVMAEHAAVYPNYLTATQQQVILWFWQTLGLSFFDRTPRSTLLPRRAYQPLRQRAVYRQLAASSFALTQNLALR